MPQRRRQQRQRQAFDAAADDPVPQAVELATVPTPPSSDGGDAASPSTNNTTVDGAPPTAATAGTRRPSLAPPPPLPPPPHAHPSSGEHHPQIGGMVLTASNDVVGEFVGVSAEVSPVHPDHDHRKRRPPLPAGAGPTPPPAAATADGGPLLPPPPVVHPGDGARAMPPAAGAEAGVAAARPSRERGWSSTRSGSASSSDSSFEAIVSSRTEAGRLAEQIGRAAAAHVTGSPLPAGGGGQAMSAHLSSQHDSLGSTGSAAARQRTRSSPSFRTGEGSSQQYADSSPSGAAVYEGAAPLRIGPLVPDDDDDVPPGAEIERNTAAMMTTQAGSRRTSFSPQPHMLRPPLHPSSSRRGSSSALTTADSERGSQASPLPGDLLNDGDSGRGRSAADREAAFAAGTMAERYAAPYDYPPEAQIVAARSARGGDDNGVVLGVPVDNRDTRDGGDGAAADDGDAAATEAGEVLQAIMRMQGPPPPAPDDEMPLDELVPLVRSYRSSKHLRPIAVAELVSIGAFVTVLVWLLGALPFPALLYGAARTYSPRVLAVGVGIGVPVLLVLRVFAAFEVSSRFDTEPARSLMLVLVGITTLGDLYIGFFSWRWAHALSSIPTAVRARLQEGWVPTARDIDRAVEFAEEVEEAGGPARMRATAVAL